MSTLILQTIMSLTGLSFLGQMVSIKRRVAWLDAFNVSVMLGLMGMGVIAYAFLPLLTTTVELPLFSPHAYNLLLWPAMALLVLRKRFEPKYLLLMLAFVYAIDELVWNGIAVAYYWAQWNVLTYVFLPNWHEFMAVLLGIGALSYWIVRPRFNVNITSLILPAFAFFWAWVAGFPTLAATNVLSLDFQQTLYRMAWEIMWQCVFWVWVFASVKPRETAQEIEVLRPSVG